MSAPTDRRHSPRVELYQRIVAAIDDGTFPPGAKLPAEPVLAARLGVSRPALREVLILLQEDGVITRRQGSGSTVNQPPPPPGLERLLPVEKLLGAGTVRCRRLAVELEEPTDFSGYHLRLGPAERARFWESVVDVDGVPACFAHEWAAEGAVREHLTEAVLDQAAPPGQPCATMLATLLAAAGRLPLTGRSTLGATTLGKERGQAVSRPPETPALLVTQTVAAAGRPLMAAKYLFPAGAPLLHLNPRR
ncbi:GntR family transcriptional regulator [Streptantibioticus cattleyicolor]|uniref:GntR family transcriptional regulator n=1 Tax=Streptantibioticus cattleyicolor (strain ATCC 35852 / DSM 46488 / JCM 4925 / NBRC 14057 / NRRL 8057) TaxID=1003195 RepID=F8JN00_STREN|nr:GntR family transcriptional regulator [Streptantibioticus cattleyicolor]AEW98416.1 GntR family transcriptional regulator [Streptantibioticus cattleyicolor NRRL 8057 = DSM 46488]CCB72525.1 Transcriptional regulator, GntR family [Streptantibioticus cattleyicolor NRRL 8057 = DSM 46488]